MYTLQLKVIYVIMAFSRKKKHTHSPIPENQNVKFIAIANIVQRTELGMIE